MNDTLVVIASRLDDITGMLLAIAIVLFCILIVLAVGLRRRPS